MKWRFSCYVCGTTYELQHRGLDKDLFYGKKKEGRPTINCVECEMNNEETRIVGDMIGGRK
jgi:hypothetical protein